MKRKSPDRLVGAFKTVSTKPIKQLWEMPGTPFWQPNYRERIICNEESLDRIRENIKAIPSRWADDQLHPSAAPNRELGFHD